MNDKHLTALILVVMAAAIIGSILAQGHEATSVQACARAEHARQQP